MNRGVTTYKKDYSWPDDMSAECRPETSIKSIPCACIDVGQAFKELLQLSEESRDCSRRDRPKERPLKQKFCVKAAEPILRTDARPERLRNCLTKVEEMRDLCETSRDPFATETNAQVEADRLKTTYQTDYSDPAMTRLEEADLRVKMYDRESRCSMPIRITIEADCQLPCPPRPSKCNGSLDTGKCRTKRKSGQKCKKRETEKIETRLPAWKSEYQDSINKIGQIILKHRLHGGKKKTVPIWVISN